jgi:hypothetical protein
MCGALETEVLVVVGRLMDGPGVFIHLAKWSCSCAAKTPAFRPVGKLKRALPYELVERR